MQLGMPTLLEAKTLEECASLCRELGLQFIELNMNLPQYQTANMDEKEFTDIAQRYGIFYTIHLDENLNPCDFNPLVAKAYMDTALMTVEAAKALHAPVLNMHLNHGVHFKMPGENVYLFDAYLDTYLGWLLLSSDAFALTFDIGHNYCMGGSDEDIILQYENKLCHMHMHDALGSRCHLALGTGEIDVMKYLIMARRLNLRIVLETKTLEGLRQSAAYVNTQLR